MAVCPSLRQRTVPQQLLQLRTVLAHCCQCSRPLTPGLAPQQGGAQWDKLKSAGFVGGHLSQHQISAGALCNQLPKKPLLLMSFPPNHEPCNKIHRAASLLTPVTTLLTPMTTLPHSWCRGPHLLQLRNGFMCFYSSLLFMIFICCVFIWCVYVAGAWFSLFLTAFQIICSTVLSTFSFSTKF